MANVLAWIVFALACVITSSYSCYVILEKDTAANLQCNFANNSETSITWQLLDGNTTTNLSTCSFIDNTCIDHQGSDIYQGFVSSSGSDRGLGLNVTRARVNETQFSCLTDGGLRSSLCQLEVYAWPEKPECRDNLTDTHLEFTCRTSSVYPNVTATLHRRQTDFTENDNDIISKECYNGPIGIGRYGDIVATCTWRIPIGIITPGTTVFAEMAASVSNSSIVNRTPVLSNDSNIQFTVPVAVLNDNDCPSGRGVFWNSTLVATNAHCSCYLKKRGFPVGIVQWYTHDNRAVGEMCNDNRSSTVHFSYNSSDPHQSYECRPSTKLKAQVDSVIYTPQFRNSYSIVEKGQATRFECPVENTTHSLTWQVLRNNSEAINISTCSIVTNTCIDVMPLLYKAFVGDSANGKVSGINVSSARTNETLFVYMTDGETKSLINELEVYAWPTTANCSQNITSQAVYFTCTTGNVYPAVRASVHRRVTKLTYYEISGDDFIDPSDIPCKVGAYESGTSGDYSASCSFQIPLHLMIPNSHIYVQMAARVSRRSFINKTALVSEDVVTDNIFPKAELTDCPVGLGVKRNTVLLGTHATCTCRVKATVFYDGYVEWYTANWDRVDQENVDGKSTRLTVQYKSSELNGTYNCVARLWLGRVVDTQYFTPKYRSFPSVVLSRCPSGPGVKRDIIPAKTNATCKCELSKSELSEEGFARWFTKTDEIVGKENPTDNSSMLTVSYKSSDQNETYGCWAITIDGRSDNVKYFTPHYKSSAESSTISILHSPVITAIAVWYGIVSRMS
jgi:hypothetical protein